MEVSFESHSQNISPACENSWTTYKYRPRFANKMENYESMIFWAENLEKTQVKYSLMLLTEEDTKIN
jgi:hypothetical protein